MFSLHVVDRSAQNKADFEGSNGDQSPTRIGHNRRDSTKALLIKFIASRVRKPRATNSISATPSAQQRTSATVIDEFGRPTEKAQDRADGENIANNSVLKKGNEKRKTKGVRQRSVRNLLHSGRPAKL